MKRLHLSIILLALAVTAFGLNSFLIPVTPNAPQQGAAKQDKNYTAEWKQADSLMQIRQVQTAQVIVDKIYKEAQTQQNTPQFVKACIYRMSLQNSYEEDAAAKMIEEMEAVVKTADFPAKNILHSVAADFYWNYYQQNRWRIQNRTATAIISNDIRTWDLRKIVEKGIVHYTASLEKSKDLQLIPIAQYEAILEKHPESRKYRPSLYDFLAFRAVEFYSNNEADLVQPAVQFVIDNENYFAPAANFALLELNTPDSLSFKFQALRLLQNILHLHLPDADLTAFIDADLQRLDLVYAHSVSTDKDSLYLHALQQMDAQYKIYPESTEVLYRIAKLHNEQGDKYDAYTNPATQWKKKEAMDIIEQAITRFPESMGANNCRALQNEIRRPLLTLTTDDANLPNKPILAGLQYQNISKIYIKIVLLDFKRTLEERDTEENTTTFYAKQKAIKTWSIALPNDNDYQPHHTDLALPELIEGYYVVLLSSDSTFSAKSKILAENKIWISNLSYVRKTDSKGATIMLLHRETGKPISAVAAQIYTREYNYNKRRYVVKFSDTLHSNAEGIIDLKATANYHSVNLLFTHGKDRYADENNMSLYRYNDNRSSSFQTTFFTDRAIYRPGQTVYFKGIVLHWDKNKNSEASNAIIAEKLKQTLTFYNVNQEKISEMNVVTNEFGSFSGSFIIPMNGLTGMMSIQTNNGRILFRVEEYKRPKFEVIFAPVDKSFRLGEKIMVTGNAKAYAGNAVSEARGTYRVVREARYPYWRWWHGSTPSSPKQEIANGVLTTKSDGSFDIEFTALPDAKIVKSDKPVFTYKVYATVSDINGETHDAQTSIAVSYQSLLVSTDIPEKVNLDKWEKIEINATNLSGKAQPAKGHLTIWKLQDAKRVLQARKWQRPDKFIYTREAFEQMFPQNIYDDEDNLAERKKEKEMLSIDFDTKEATKYTISHTQTWPVGNYLITLSTQDAFGETIEASTIFTGFSISQKTVPAKQAIWFEVLNPTVQPGDKVKVLLGSAYKNVQAIFEIVEEDKQPTRRIEILNSEQKVIEIPVLENHRGNFGINVFFVRHNHLYMANQIIQVPFENKKLNLEFATFRDKLQPGQKEEWRITIKDKAGDAMAAELLASMYDASLDAFVPHQWNFFPWNNNNISFSWKTDIAFQHQPSNLLANNYPWVSLIVRNYDRLLGLGYPLVEGNKVMLMGYTNDSQALEGKMAGVQVRGVASMRKKGAKNLSDNMALQEEALSEDTESEGIISSTTQNQAPLQIRTNFNETAFFYPQLRTNEQGETVISFTIPEALTRWKMQGLAWTKDLKTGSVTKELLTQKDLMIFTNTPRFFRENDTIYFSAKLSNISEKNLDVKTNIQFFDALTIQAVSEKLLLENDTKNLSLTAGENKSLSWKMYIPEGLQAITYRITASSNGFSDGEENTIPVLTNRMLVTESLPLPIRGNQSKTFEFAKLLHNESKTLKNYAYTVEFTSNPAWNAVQALPYIMEYPYECAEQAFSRYYANSIASHIVSSDPKIKQVFDIWRNYQPNALQSNLEKNEELKSLLLEETPWVRAAQNEKERKQRIAVLFDLNRMNNELGSALRKVQQAQTSNGGFAWFKGGPDNHYITQHIVAGVGHLLKMGIDANATDNMVQNAITYLDNRLLEDYIELKKHAEKNKTDYKKEEHLSYLTIHYIYARSFFISPYAIPKDTKEAFDFYKAQAVKYWPKQNNYMQGMIALALHRYGDTKTAQLIMKSLSETALHSDEVGMYWHNETHGWWWYQAPIETQALMIEAYDEILNDQKSVDELKVWLLKQKQTQDWKTTKATSEAVYALLRTGRNLLASDALVQITVGSQVVDPNKLEGDNKPEAGTGYFKTSWKGEEVKPEMGKISVKNPNQTVAWGAAYWQYFEQLDKITPAKTNVKINKQLYVKTNSAKGPVLMQITDKQAIKVGDKVVVRIEIICDRDMEYIHLKDMRAATFEPVNVLSGYRWQDGLGYYQSTRDAATNFFIADLPKGTYVFEYEVFATQQGEFSNGITSLQCMYAPEFTTHSEGIRIVVKE